MNQVNQKNEGLDLSASIQRALLGVIGKNVKAISMRFEKDTLYLVSYHYNKPKEKEKDDINVVLTEVHADFPGKIKRFNSDFIAWDGDSSYKWADYLVYLRKD